jgi:hypothetical protein
VRRRPVLVAALLLGAVPLLTGCGVAENAVSGVVDEARSGVDDAVGDAVDQAREGVDGAVGDVVDQARSGLDDAVGDVLGGAAITDDGALPRGFPSDAVPLTGEVLGGGAAPDSLGWAVRTRLAGADQFSVAQSALEAAGFASSAVDSDGDSGFGTFTSDAHRVVLASTTDADGLVTATWLVTPV